MKKDNMNPSQKMKESANDKGQMQMSDHDQMHAGKMTDMSMDHEHMHQQTDMASMQMSHHDMGHMAMDHSGMDMHMDHGNMDHGGGHMMHMGNLKQKFWVSLIVMIPVLLLAQFMGMNIHLGVIELPIVFPGSDWVVLVLSSFLFFYGGWPFLTGAKAELQQRQPAMMTLIAMGITVAYGYSLYAFLMNNFIAPNGMVMDFFWELATLIVIMLLGHWIEMNAVMA
ncbi:ATPase, partial [Lacticaseibacillus rhamnosus]